MSGYDNPWISIADLLSSVVIVLLIMLLFFSLIPRINKEQDKANMMEQFSSSLKEFEDRNVLKVIEEQMLIELSEFTFDRGSACINNEVSDIFMKLSPLIKESLLEIDDLSILIEGHTDTRPVNGVVNSCGYFENNFQLSALRAINVRKKLTSELASPILLNRIGASGYGATQLKNIVDPYSTENRRIEIRLIL